AGQYDSYEDFVRVLFINRFALVKKHFPILKVFIQEIAFHSELKEQYQKIFTNHVLEKFTEIIEHFQEKGELIDIPPSSVIRMTMTSIVGFILTRFLVIPERDWDDELEIEQTIQFMMHGLRKKC
ncbi:MAG: TetR/AcrR family transcriptional regulator, partial [Bacilli bacterium]